MLSSRHRRAIRLATHFIAPYRWQAFGALLALIVSIYPASKLGSEFMPTLNEGSLLYMPASLPGMSITKAA